MSVAALTLALNFLPLHIPEERLDEALCLTEAIHYEANGEPWEGKKAVAFVFDKRVDIKRFPDDYCGVLNDAGQIQHRAAGVGLSDVVLTEPGDLRSFDETMDIVILFMEGELEDPTQGADHFYNPDFVKVTPLWARNPYSRVIIGNHLFLQVYP